MTKKLGAKDFFSDMWALDANGCTHNCFIEGTDLCPLAKLAVKKGLKVPKDLKDPDLFADKVINFLREKYHAGKWDYDYLDQFYGKYDSLRDQKGINKMGSNRTKEKVLRMLEKEYGPFLG